MSIANYVQLVALVIQAGCLVAMIRIARRSDRRYEQDKERRRSMVDAGGG